MTLDAWLTAASLTDAEFARRSGIVHKQLVGNYRSGKQKPATVNMRRIYAATSGAVTANDFFLHPVALSTAPSPKVPG